MELFAENADVVWCGVWDYRDAGHADTAEEERVLTKELEGPNYSQWAGGMPNYNGD